MKKKPITITESINKCTIRKQIIYIIKKQFLSLPSIHNFPSILVMLVAYGNRLGIFLIFLISCHVFSQKYVFLYDNRLIVSDLCVCTFTYIQVHIRCLHSFIMCNMIFKHEYTTNDFIAYNYINMLWTKIFKKQF